MGCRLATLLLVFLLLPLPGCEGQPASAEQLPAPAPAKAPPVVDRGPTDSVEARVERAVVKIELFKGNRSMSYGTGFFVSSDGLLATNYHVFSDVLERKHEPVFYLDKSKTKTTRSYQVIRCMDSRDIDICLLKLAVEPSHHLEVTRRRPKVGESVFTIGNPKGNDFSLERGEIEHVYRDIHKSIQINDYSRNRRVEMIRLKANLRKGFSGGPVVDREGRVLGINSVILHPPKKGGRELYLAISARELSRYLSKKSKFDVDAFTAKQIRRNPILTTAPDKLTESQIKKACATLQKDECIAGIKAACQDERQKPKCRRLRAFFRGLMKKDR